MTERHFCSLQGPEMCREGPGGIEKASAWHAHQIAISSPPRQSPVQLPEHCPPTLRSGLLQLGKSAASHPLNMVRRKRSGLAAPWQSFSVPDSGKNHVVNLAFVWRAFIPWQVLWSNSERRTPSSPTVCSWVKIPNSSNHLLGTSRTMPSACLHSSLTMLGGYYCLQVRKA